jgi:hypothetical protein
MAGDRATASKRGELLVLFRAGIKQSVCMLQTVQTHPFLLCLLAEKAAPPHPFYLFVEVTDGILVFYRSFFAVC